MSDFIPTYKWNLTDLEKVKKNGLKVFSTFACGGGSTMGYKLAGFDVIGANDIDPEMAWHYKENHKPKYYYLEDIRKFRQREDLPKELYQLDILDGSPPCSSFSMAGSREKGWGKKKKFREGQAEQTLDDLFFDFIELARKLQPKVVVAENVKGMLQGNAKGYVKQIIGLFNVVGYDVQLFLLNAATMGVPQKRERVFLFAKEKTSILKS
jgi:DNA (cytosine-5)-methyltransferase 1